MRPFVMTLILLSPFLGTASAQVSLTEAGCCTQAFWGPDSRSVLYLDRVGDELGLYRVTVDGGTDSLKRVTSQVGFYSDDLSYVAYPDGAALQIARVNGEPLARINNARNLWFSPDSRRLLWQRSEEEGPYNERASNLFVAALDGNGTRQVATSYGGGFAGWLDGRRILVSGSPDLEADYQQLYTLDLDTGTARELVRVGLQASLRGVSPSPDGRWLAYAVTFATDSNQNGLWLSRSDGSERHRLDVFGAYRWRSPTRLLIIPLTPGEPLRLLELNAETLRLTELDTPPLHIANGDWQVSPDGRYLLYLSSETKNLQVVELPGD